MQPRMPRPPLSQIRPTNTAFLAIAWTVFAVNFIGVGYMGFTALASLPLQSGYTSLGIALARSSNRINRINGWILVCYSLFTFLLFVSRRLRIYVKSQAVRRVRGTCGTR